MSTETMIEGGKISDKLRVIADAYRYEIGRVNADTLREAARAIDRADDATMDRLMQENCELRLSLRSLKNHD